MQLVSDATFDWQKFNVQSELSKVVPMSTNPKKIVDTFYGQQEQVGTLLPWRSAIQHDLRIRKGEVSVYAGVNGNWKSMVTSQIALHLMNRSEKVMIASFEMLPEKTMKRMVRQAADTDQPAIPWMHRFLRWTDGRGLLYSHYGRCNPKKVLAVCRYAATECGVQHMFIDSLMKVIDAVDDYSGQKLFVEDLCTIAQDTGMHIHLVAHARKGADETDRIDKFSIKGASEIGDQADNLFLCQRNIRKERRAGNPKHVEEDRDVPDFFYTVSKQRDGEFQGTLGLFWNKKSLCVVDNPNGSAGHINLEQVIETNPEMEAREA
jgi:twinkle protein